METLPLNAERAVILGVDPSLRHIGLCLLLKGGSALFHEIKPEGDVLSATREMQRQLKLWLAPNQGCFRYYSVEHQLSVGAHMSAMMFNSQMAVLDTLYDFQPLVEGFVFPLPSQLKSYIKWKWGKNTPIEGRPYTEFFQKLTGLPKVSVHCTDAYFLARLALDVAKGHWGYPLPKRETKLVPWEVKHGRV